MSKKPADGEREMTGAGSNELTGPGAADAV